MLSPHIARSREPRSRGRRQPFAQLTLVMRIVAMAALLFLGAAGLARRANAQAADAGVFPPMPERRDPG